ncbi:DNA polymerase III subunit alpha [Inconstantimicrobium porci]|uniref:DNA polymerase III subunit alpha n=1 Tax=Inconstantimicrobium porci TaxID=2652291 RepID=UPI002408F72B|nr:DNA polymerase III subunit alpha [Inconstantimicrobium porci]MDD6769704.1 DNA polymerase III subunit alpha [Inconstantimicrobium porci]
MAVHLHVHTSGSLLDGACDCHKVMEMVKSQGETAVAITDHGSMIKAYEFYKEAINAGIKPIIGCEFYTGEHDDHNRFHLILLAKNNKGLKNLFLLLNKGYSNFYYKPRLSRQMIEKYKEGLICLSACLGSELAKNFFIKEEKAEQQIKYMRNVFGEDFYLEIQANTLKNQTKYNNFLQKMSLKFKIPTVVTCDAHYVSKSDYSAQDTMQCMGIKKKKSDENRMKFETNDFYLKTDDEIKKTLQYMDSDFVQQCINNTKIVADKCDVHIEQYDAHEMLPALPGVKDPDFMLRQLCNEGFKRRLNEGAWKGIPIKEVTDRVRYELDVIKQKGYPGYFLIVDDFTKWCKKNGIPFGGGRGSVAGSEIAYILGISEAEPIKYGLLFERFLNPTRQSPPDIDSDVSWLRRGEIIQYLIDKYGKDNVCHIMAEGTLSLKQVITKVMTVYSFEPKVIRATTKEIPDTVTTIAQLKEHCKDICNKIGEKALDDMTRLEGLMAIASMHAAGILITPKPVINYFPVRVKDDIPICEWHKKICEGLGGYKFDMLGLKQLDIYDYALKFIYKNYGKKMTIQDLYKIDFNDPNIYKFLNSGNLESIFQFTGESAKQVINQMKPGNFDDIMVAESICRPGVKEAQQYLKNKKDFMEKGSFEKPSYYDFVKDILDESYGCIVYQEQTLMLFNKSGNFTLGEADKLRKVHDLEPYRERFVTGWMKNGMTEEQANELFNRFDLGYCFNKSHACVYGMHSAISAWFMAYYPKEYMAGAMTIELTSQKPNIPAFMKTCKKLGIKLIPPSINDSSDIFVANKEGIIFPINCIAGVGESAYLSICKNKPYNSFHEFLIKNPKKDVKKTCVVNLIKAGVFDCFNSNRSILLSDYYNSRNEDTEVFFYCDEVQMMYEKEVFGFTISINPLDGYVNKDFLSVENGTNTVINCMVTSVKEHKDKKGNTMCFLELENGVCQFSGVVFSRTYNLYKNLLKEGMKLKLIGKKDGSLLVNKVEVLT